MTIWTALAAGLAMGVGVAFGLTLCQMGRDFVGGLLSSAMPGCPECKRRKEEEED